MKRKHLALINLLISKIALFPMAVFAAGFNPKDIPELVDPQPSIAAIEASFHQKFPEDSWLDATPQTINSHFTVSEIISYELSQVYLSEVWQTWENDKGPLGFIHGTINAFWTQDAQKDNTYNLVSRYLRFFKNLDFGPQFSVEVDVIRAPFTERGCGRNSNVYFDGVMGMILSYNGAPAVHIGLTPSVRGVLIGQVQMAKKKGNRWLYTIEKEGVSYLEFFLNHLHTYAMKEHIPVWLVEGQSLANVIRKSHNEDANAFNETFHRITSFYNQSLANFQTVQLSKIGSYGLIYRQLEKTKATSQRSGDEN